MYVQKAKSKYMYIKAILAVYKLRVCTSRISDNNKFVQNSNGAQHIHIPYLIMYFSMLKLIIVFTESFPKQYLQCH